MPHSSLLEKSNFKIRTSTEVVSLRKQRSLVGWWPVYPGRVSTEFGFHVNPQHSFLILSLAVFITLEYFLPFLLSWSERTSACHKLLRRHMMLSVTQSRKTPLLKNGIFFFFLDFFPSNFFSPSLCFPFLSLAIAALTQLWHFRSGHTCSELKWERKPCYFQNISHLITV